MSPARFLEGSDSKDILHFNWITQTIPETMMALKLTKSNLLIGSHIATEISQRVFDMIGLQIATEILPRVSEWLPIRCSPPGDLSTTGNV